MQARNNPDQKHLNVSSKTSRHRMTLIKNIWMCPPKHAGIECPWSRTSQCVLQNMQARMTLIRSISMCPPKHAGTEWPWSGASWCVLQNMQAQNDLHQEHLDVSSKTCRDRVTLIWKSLCVLQNMHAQNDLHQEHLSLSSKICRHWMTLVRSISICPPKHADTEWPWSGASHSVLQTMLTQNDPDQVHLNVSSKKNMLAYNDSDQEHLGVSSKACWHRITLIRSISMCPPKHAGIHLAKVLISQLEYSEFWLKYKSFRSKTCFSLW